MSIPILNPFKHSPNKNDHNCFGCSPYNSAGLKLEFIDFGEYIEAHWMPQKQFEGFNNVLHGGIQATLLDEVAAWVVFTKCETSGVTQSIQVIYHAPVYVLNNIVRITGKLISKSDKVAVVRIKLFNSDGKLCAQADAEYYLFPEAVAKRKYFYPGVEAFYTSSLKNND
jgi:uncharacterized protein (TIGR00369 family)